MKATITYEGMIIDTEATAQELQELIFGLKDGPVKTPSSTKSEGGDSHPTDAE